VFLFNQAATSLNPRQPETDRVDQKATGLELISGPVYVDTSYCELTPIAPAGAVSCAGYLSHPSNLVGKIGGCG
jgi:hypothetical protein